jgi:hypothetical protein
VLCLRRHRALDAHRTFVRFVPISNPARPRNTEHVSHAERVKRRRAKARRLREDGASVRAVARKLGVSTSTAHADLRADDDGAELEPVRNLQDQDGRPVAGATGGNERSLSHGAYSERHVAPIREEHNRELTTRYPWVTERRRQLQAQRLAQIDLGARWIEHRGVVRDDEGRVFDIATKVSEWSRAAERWFADAEEERPERSVDLSEFAVEEDG